MKSTVAISLLIAIALPPAARTAPTELKLVYMNLVAVDGRGEPVTDLASNEITIEDAGKPETIVLFNRREVRFAQSAPLQPDQYSNRDSAIAPHPTVILFDLLNERFATRGVAANQIVQALQSLETSADIYLYLLNLDGRVLSVRGLPEGGAAPPQGAPAWTRDIKARMDAALRQALRIRPPEIDLNIRIELTYRALDEMARELSRVPGRKNIVWITDGVPLALTPSRSDTGDFVDYTPLIRRFSEAMAHSGVAIYPVQQIMIGSPDAMGTGLDGFAGGDRAPAVGSTAGMESMATLNEFAGLTGGRINQGKDIGAAIKQSRSDLSNGYRIGYYPALNNWDGKFHKLRIRCARKGVKIQAKTGYYAWKVDPEQETREAIQFAMSAEFDAAEIGLRGTAHPDAKDPQLWHFNIRADANDIALPGLGGESTATLRLATIAQLDNGVEPNSKVEGITLRYTGEQRAKALAEGIEVNEDVKLVAGARAVRFIVFDCGSTAIGSITVPIHSGGAPAPPH